VREGVANPAGRGRNIGTQGDRDMSIESLLKGLKQALPVILANAPAVIAAVKEVKKAVKKKKKKAVPDAAA
jgi:hypothetical protein